MRMSATAPLSRSRNDLPPSGQELRASGSPWSAPRKREQDVSARRTKVPSLFAGRNRKLRFRRTPLRAARPCQLLFPTLETLYARRRPCGRVPRCDESGRPGTLRAELPGATRRRGREPRCRLRKGEAKSPAANLQMFFQRRDRGGRRVARGSALAPPSCCHRRTPYSRRDGSSCIRRERRREPVHKHCASPLPRAVLARDTGPGGRPPTILGLGEVRLVALRSGQTRRTETESVRCNRPIDLPGLRWIRCADLIHLRGPAERLPR